MGDVKGLRFVCPIGPVWSSLWASLGASPTSIDLSETYSALQTGIVEAQEGAWRRPRATRSMRCKNIRALTGHMWDGWWIIGHKESWNKLPDDIKDIVWRNLTQTAMEERAAMAADAQHTQERLAALGLIFNTVDQKLVPRSAAEHQLL